MVFHGLKMFWGHQEGLNNIELCAEIGGRSADGACHGGWGNVTWELGLGNKGCVRAFQLG